MIHPLAGVLSAYGIGLADERLIRAERAVEAPSMRLLASLAAIVGEMGDLAKASRWRVMSAANASIAKYGCASKPGHRHTGLEVPFGALADITRAFETAYRQRFSFAMPDRALIVEAVSVEAISRSDAPVNESPPPGRRWGGWRQCPAHAADSRPSESASTWRAPGAKAHVFAREALGVSMTVAGPRS
ncbi:MAG: hypothetical protein U1E87_08335 [Alphaproteobacteria bacterium]